MKRLILIIFFLTGFSFQGVSIVRNNKIDKPINVSYNDMMKYLKNFYKMKLSKIDNTNRYLGTTKYSLFEMIGDKNNLTSTTLILFINPKDQKSTNLNSALLLRFLNNAAPEWKESNTWAFNSLNKMTSGESEVEEETIGEKTIKMSYLKNSSSFLIVVKHKKE
jgi:hypothetical protein